MLSLNAFCAMAFSARAHTRSEVCIMLAQSRKSEVESVVQGSDWFICSRRTLELAQGDGLAIGNGT